VILYVDASAFLKLYFEEPGSDRAEEILASDQDWVTARHSAVEVRRNLARALEGGALAAARRQFQRDWEHSAVVEPTEEVCESAARLAELTGARSLAALHLGALQVVGGGALPLVTFDVRQAQAARGLGWVVLRA
jgi:hypothetical protein